jgi:glycosyltransferase involved in cell wall biosynthesis
MSIILQKYSDSFTWFSLRPPLFGTENPFEIPYKYVGLWKRPARFPNLKRLIQLFPRAWHLGNKAASFGRSQNVQVVLADLAFDAVVAGRVAAQVLGVPLLVSVHDDPVSRIRVKNYPAGLVERYEREFAKTIRVAAKCGVISDYMGEVYKKNYGIETTTLFIGVEKQKCLPVRNVDLQKWPLMIGSIGSINSSENWNLLLEAVTLLNRRSGKTRFTIFHIGSFPANLRITEDVEITGWVPEDEFLHHLSRIDVGFLNWSFDPKYAVTRRMSFPLKITSYIQAQVPMLALGPADSSAVRFVQEYQCGIICTEPSVEELANRLETFIQNEDEKAKATRGVEKLIQVFSRDRFFESFETFVQV